jgi:transposase
VAGGGAHRHEKSIDGLAQLVVDSLDRQPVSGEVFAFSKRGRDKVKLLWYERTGFWLAYKRLERGRFRWPRGGRLDRTERAASAARGGGSECAAVQASAGRARQLKEQNILLQ